MPYKDPQKAKAAKRASYLRNKDKVVARSTERKRKIRAWLNDIKSKMKCARCPESHIATLDFHHRDPTQKDANVSKILADTFSKKKILAEIDKCDVLCANCHRKLHHDEGFK